MLLAAAVIAASLGKATRKDGSQFGNFSPLLEQAIHYGRPAALICLAVYLLTRGRKTVGFVHVRFFDLGALLFIVQAFFAAKLSYYGNDFQAFAGFAIFAFAFTACYAANRGNALQNVVIVRAITGFGITFALLNVLAEYFYPQASQTDFGRFFGLMVNPQHLAMTAVMPIPAMISFAEDRGNSAIARMCTAVGISALVFLVYLSSSRMGMLAIFAIACLYLTSGRRTFYKYLAAALFCIAAAWALGILEPSSTALLDRFVYDREDTRLPIWQREIAAFVENPLFGSGVDADGRIQLAESAWLTLLASGGVVGGALAAGIATRGLVLGAWLKTKRGISAGRAWPCIGVLVILLLAAFEAIFLGVLTSMTLLTLLYFAAAENLINTPTSRSSHTSAAIRQMSARKIAA